MPTTHGLTAESADPSGNARLQIAFVTETYPPEINGVAMTVARLVEGLALRGHRIELIRPRQPGVPPLAIPDGVTEVLTRGLPIPWYPELKVGFPAGRSLRRGWEKRRPDLVHIATEGPLGWSALRAARQLGIPVVSEFRTNFHAYSRHYGIGFLKPYILAYLRRFHNGTARTMVPTTALGRELQVAGFERLEVVARGVDARLFDPARRSEELRRSWGAGPETLVALGVGRLAPEKNLGLMAAAFSRARAVRRDSRLVLVGDGPARAAMAAECPEAVFAGRRSAEDLATHFASADLLLFPSVTETFGNVTLEGMASGLGVVAFDYGAAGDVIRHGVNGWVAPLGDDEAFKRAVAGAVVDLEAIRRVGLSARGDALKLGWDRILSQVEASYFGAMVPGANETLLNASEPTREVVGEDPADAPLLQQS